MGKTIQILLLCLLSSSAFAQNGSFDAPNIDDYLELTDSEHQLYLDRLGELDKEDFLERPTYRGQSYHATARGQKELLELSQKLLAERHNVSRYVFIGRSGSALQAFLQGFVSVLEDDAIPPTKDLPYSHRGAVGQITDEMRDALKDHLRINGLDPQTIASSKKPILFVDAVYSGTGALSLLTYIMDWAHELGISDEVKSKISFFALHPAELLAKEQLDSVARASAKEMGGYFPPSKEEIKATARRIMIPQSHRFHAVAGNVIEAKISRELYTYGSIQIENAQTSFTMSDWLRDFDRSQHIGFEGQSANKAFLEIYFLIHEGRRIGRLVSTMRNCRSDLLDSIAHFEHM